MLAYASGVDGVQREIEGAAGEADLTVSFHAAKLGHRIAPGKWHSGELRVAPIGIPDGAAVEPAAGTIAPSVLALAPGRGRRSTKFSSGQVIAGGSRGLTGQWMSSLLAAISRRRRLRHRRRPRRSRRKIPLRLAAPEVMSVGRPGGDGCVPPRPPTRCFGLRERAAAAVVLGPGIGTGPWLE